MIKALLIDLDGVIRHWPPDVPGFVEKYGLSMADVKRAAFSEALLIPAITGRVTDEEWREQIALQLLGAGFADAERAVAAWSAGSGEVDQVLLNRVQRLRPKCKVILVTNATTRLMRDLAALGLCENFDEVINSSVVGYAKPSAEVFKAALNFAGARAEEAIFVDDTLTNVDAAQALGISSHHYLCRQGFDSFLASQGLV